MVTKVNKQKEQTKMKRALTTALKKQSNPHKHLTLTALEARALELYNSVEEKKQENTEVITLRLPKELAAKFSENQLISVLNDFVSGNMTKNAQIDKPFLHKVHDLIKGQRQTDYGNKLENFAHIAMFFQAVLAPKLQKGTFITPEEVGMMMQGVKMARHIKSPTHEDSFLDNAGYAGCIAEVIAERKALMIPVGAITDANAWMVPDSAKKD